MTDRLESLRKLHGEVSVSAQELRNDDVDWAAHRVMSAIGRWQSTLSAFLAAEDARQPASAAQGAQEPVPFAWEYTERSTTTDGAPTGVVTLTHQPPDRVSDLHRYTYRPLYASPPAPVVTEALTQRLVDAMWAHGLSVEPTRDYTRTEANRLANFRAALESALRGERT